jgi:hypothetical protein
MDPNGLGLDASLLEAIKKLKENDPYNPTGSGPANIPSEPSSNGKINVADEKKHTKGCTCNECNQPMPGYIKTDRV